MHTFPFITFKEEVCFSGGGAEMAGRGLNKDKKLCIDALLLHSLQRYAVEPSMNIA